MGKFPKKSPKWIQVRFCTGYVEVITGKLEPHLNHVLHNSLILNVFNILHQKKEVWYSIRCILIEAWIDILKQAKTVFLIDQPWKQGKETDLSLVTYLPYNISRVVIR